MNALKTTRVARCDEVAIRILGLSLAGWNAVVCLAIATIAGRAAYGSSSVSQ
jgi:disulfide bond formation protein DsbB